MLSLVEEYRYESPVAEHRVIECFLPAESTAPRIFPCRISRTAELVYMGPVLRIFLYALRRPVLVWRLSSLWRMAIEKLGRKIVTHLMDLLKGRAVSLAFVKSLVLHQTVERERSSM